MCVLAKLLQSCLTLCDPIDCSPPASCPWGFSRQEYLSGLPCPSPGDIPNPGIEPRSPALLTDSLPSESPAGKPKNTRVGRLSLLQENFQTQELNHGLLHWQAGSWSLAPPWKPQIDCGYCCTAGGGGGVGGLSLCSPYLESTPLPLTVIQFLYAAWLIPSRKFSLIWIPVALFSPKFLLYSLYSFTWHSQRGQLLFA